MVNGAPAVGAPKGRIQLVSVASPGEVVFSRLELAPELQIHGFARLGRLELLDANIRSRGSDIMMQAGSVRLAGGLINSSGADLQPGGDVTITATDSITLSPSALIAGPSVAISTPILSLKEATIGGLELDIRVDRLSLLDGSALVSTAEAFGEQAGNVAITATDSIVISGHRIGSYTSGPTFIPSQLNVAGEKGRVVISAPSLYMDEGRIGTDAVFDVGRDVEVRVDRLTLTGGAQIISSTFGSGGDAGNIRINATESVMISGKSTGSSGRNTPCSYTASTLFFIVKLPESIVSQVAHRSRVGLKRAAR